MRVVSKLLSGLDEMAFLRCTQLTTVNIGEALEEIVEGAFGVWTLLRSIIIPSTVRVIEENTFARCTQLTTVTLG
jgi:hypothetical protein